jgi:cobalamin biosynthesis protein CbiD
MAMIQIQDRKNFTDYVMIDGGFGVNIITKNLRMQLGLPKPNPTPYNMWMAEFQTIVKPLALVENPPFSITCHFRL